MTTSAFDGTFQSLTLTRQLEGGAVDPDTQLWVEGEASTESFRVWLKETTDPQVRAEVGADTLQSAVRGRMLEPLTPPVTSHSGAVYDVTETGQKLTLKWRLPSPIAEIDEELGRAFVGVLA